MRIYRRQNTRNSQDTGADYTDSPDDFGVRGSFFVGDLIYSLSVRLAH